VRDPTVTETFTPLLGGRRGQKLPVWTTRLVSNAPFVVSSQMILVSTSSRMRCVAFGQHNLAFRKLAINRLCRALPAGGRGDLLYLDKGTFTFVWECGRTTVIHMFHQEVPECGVTVFHYFWGREELQLASDASSENRGLPAVPENRKRNLVCHGGAPQESGIGKCA